jgi:hypothetical protein
LEHINFIHGAQESSVGCHLNTCTWDPGLRWSLDYFNMVASTCTWDLGSLAYFNIVVNTHPWDPGLWLYLLTTSIEGNTFLRGVECWDPP